MRVAGAGTETDRRFETVCSKCGRKNPEDYNYCNFCAEPNQSKYISKEEERTRTGIWLLIAATLLSWIPYISVLGLILGAVGVLLIILGRGVFGGMHYTYPVAAAVIFVAGTAAVILLVMGFASTLVSEAAGGSLTSASAISALTTLYVGEMIAGAVIGLSYVLVLYALEDRFGRTIVWSGFAAQIILSISIGYTTYSAIKDSVASALSSNPPNTAVLMSAVARLNGMGYLQLLSAIPPIFYVVGYWTVIRRIDAKELPARAESGVV